MVKEIQLVNNKGIVLVDDEDYYFLNQYKWNLAKPCYARTTLYNGNKKTIYMHSFIMNTPGGMLTDHIDGNGLNNQKNNLRIVTKSQNNMNSKKGAGFTSKYKGVNWDKDCKKWRAHITLNKKKKHLGVFINEEEAAIAYNEAAKKLFKEYANLNEV